MNRLKHFIFSICILFSLITIPVYGELLSKNEISIVVDGNAIEMQHTPKIIQDTTFVPLRDICDILQIPVTWNDETKTISMIMQNKTYTLKINSTSALLEKNKTITLSAPPTIIDGKTFVPIRFMAENSGANISWNGETKTISITTPQETKPSQGISKIQLNIGSKSVYTSEPISELKKDFGEPSRIEKSIYNLNWYIYNQDYKEFIMVAVEDNMVVGYYTNAKGFSLNDTIKYDAVITEEIHDKQIKTYTDSNHENKIYAILVVLSSYQNTTIDNSQTFLDIQAKENFDILNTFRVNNGKSILQWDNLLVESAKKHCIDMAEKRYFAHNSLNGDTHKDRILATGIQNTVAWGENIVAGKELAIDTFDLWINSEGHRVNMLRDNFTHIGIASIYKEGSVYGYYSGQNFVEKRIEKESGNSILIPV